MTIRKQIWLSILTLALAFPLGARVKGEQESECPGDTVDRMGPEIAKQSRKFLAELKAAVQENDRAKVASMILYPLEVNMEKKKLHVGDRKTFLRQYRLIIDAQVRAKILDEKSSRCLSANPQGFMVGDGEVWFREFAPGVFKIVTINTDS